VRERLKQRLYKVAYLKFKRARFGMFEGWGVLRGVYGLGWTAYREWVAWKRVVGRGEGRRRRRRERRRGLVLDGIQAKAERRIFEMMGNGPIRKVESI
jgi:hypothetical protein